MSCSQMNYLQEQYGGGGIPFSELRKKYKRSTRRRQKRSSRRKSRRIRRKRVSKRSLRRKKKTLRRRSRKGKTKKHSEKHYKKHSKKHCKCGTHHYSSQEHTPRGLGHCEECIPLNVILKGKDGNYYRNETKGWIQI